MISNTNSDAEFFENRISVKIILYFILLGLYGPRPETIIPQVYFLN